MQITLNLINKLPAIQKTFNKKPNFTGNIPQHDDTFEARIHISDNCLLSEDECRKIIDYTNTSTSEYKGINAVFYKLDDIGIKKQTKSVAREELALNYLNLNGMDSIPKSKGSFSYKNNSYLLTDILPGISPQIDNGIKLNSTHISSLMDKFLKMDKSAFLHYDLHKGNILLDATKLT